MHPQFSAIMAASRQTSSSAAPVRPESGARVRAARRVVAGIRRYFGHAIEADEQPLRRSGRRAGGARAGRRGRPARAGPALVLLGGDSGVGKTRLVGELEQRLADGRGPTDARPARRGRRAGRRRAALRAAARAPCVRWCASATRRSQALSAGQPRRSSATILPGLDDGRPRDDRRRPGRPAAAVRGAARAARPADRAEPAGADPRGHALGRPLDAHVRRVPGAQPAPGAGGAAADLPHRRAAPPPRAAPAAGRARPARARAADRARAVRPRRADRGARRHPRRRRPTRTLRRAPVRRAARATRCTPRSCWPPGSTGAAPLPQSLRDAFLVRIERLSAEAQRAARAVAVGPRARRADARRR